MRYWNFVVSLGGRGDTPEEAWRDAVDQLNAEPGEMPSEYYEDDDAEYEEA